MAGRAMMGNLTIRALDAQLITAAFQDAFPGRPVPPDAAEALRQVGGAAQLAWRLQDAILRAYGEAFPTWAFVDPFQALDRLRENAHRAEELAEVEAELEDAKAELAATTRELAELKKELSPDVDAVLATLKAAQEQLEELRADLAET